MNESDIVKPIEIFLVEDSQGDIDLIREVLEESKLKNTLNVAIDGEEALNYLKKKGRYANSTRPDLVILDLNLPKKDGREVLADMKSSPDLKSIPVVIMTTSREEEDILNMYNLHANCYITKPIDFMQFIRVVRSIEDFWFTIVRLPSKTA
jgi:CheY-like chemotaxis protein